MNKFDILVHLVWFYYRNNITMHGPMNVKRTIKRNVFLEIEIKLLNIIMMFTQVQSKFLYETPLLVYQ